MADLNTNEQILYSEDFKTGITLLPQNMMSKLMPFVQIENIKKSETKFIDYIEPLDEDSTVTKRTTRYGKTARTGMDYEKRAVVGNEYNVATLVDNIDLCRSLNDPTNQITLSLGAGMQRKIDKLICTAFQATAQIQTTNKAALGTATFASECTTIAEGNTGLTIEKLIEAQQTFDDAEVPDGARYLVATTKQRSDLLALEKVTSSDYAAIKALVHGEVDTFMGFHFIWFSNSKTYLPVASDIRDCFAFADGGMVLGVAETPRVFIDRIPEENQVYQVDYRMDLGATRLVGEKVIKIECDETPD